MTRTTSGVYQLPNGMWGYRYAYWINGKQKDIKHTKDENGNPFKTERAAIKARESIPFSTLYALCYVIGTVGYLGAVCHGNRLHITYTYKRKKIVYCQIAL